MAVCSVSRLCVWKPENRCIQHEAAAVGRKWSDSAPSKRDSCSVHRLNSAELAHRAWTPHTVDIHHIQTVAQIYTFIHRFLLYPLVPCTVTDGYGVIWNLFIVMQSLGSSTNNFFFFMLTLSFLCVFLFPSNKKIEILLTQSVIQEFCLNKTI